MIPMYSLHRLLNQTRAFTSRQPKKRAAHFPPRRQFRVTGIHINHTARDYRSRAVDPASVSRNAICSDVFASRARHPCNTRANGRRPSPKIRFRNVRYRGDLRWAAFPYPSELWKLVPDPLSVGQPQCEHSAPALQEVFSEPPRYLLRPAARKRIGCIRQLGVNALSVNSRTPLDSARCPAPANACLTQHLARIVGIVRMHDTGLLTRDQSALSTRQLTRIGEAPKSKSRPWACGQCAGSPSR
jgi:hypothetical protein